MNYFKYLSFFGFNLLDDQLLGIALDAILNSYRKPNGAGGPTKIETEPSGRPEVGLDAGMRETVEYYLARQSRLRRLRADVYSDERLGKSSKRER